MRTTLAFSTLLLLCCSTAAAGQEAAGVDSLVGCYRLDIGPWEFGGEPHSRRRPVIPDEFRLLGEIGQERAERGRRIVRPVPVFPQDILSSGTWERVGLDSVRITWSIPFEGIQLRMRVAGDSLRGVAVTYSDDVVLDDQGREVMPEAGAIARRVSCSERGVGAVSDRPRWAFFSRLGCSPCEDNLLCRPLAGLSLLAGTAFPTSVGIPCRTIDFVDLGRGRGWDETWRVGHSTATYASVGTRPEVK